MTRLSVIVPTLNESTNLPHLLEALQAQTCPPDEVIVADAGSTDGTADVARRLGAIVVPGGKPGPGRNAGARTATGDLFLFLDADVVPSPLFLARLVADFEHDGCAVATTLMEPLSDNLSERILVEVANLYMQVLQPFSPHAPGFCILIRREIHAAIGGFDENVVLAEDFDYVQRAAKHGGFSVLTQARIPVSMRRVEEDGFFQVAFKYVWCEMYALAGKPIYSVPFEYKFGAHLPAGASAGASRLLIDITQLREQLGRFENPLQRLSQTSLERLDRLARLNWQSHGPERLRLQLDPLDSAILHRYVFRRLALIRKTGRPLRETLARLQTRSLKESLRLLDANWRAALHPPAPEAAEDGRDSLPPEEKPV